MLRITYVILRMSNGYSENFIDNCLKTFLDNKHIIQKKVIILPKKPFFLVLFTLDHYHCKLEPSQENLLKVFSVVANYTLCLRAKTNQQMLLVLKIEF